MSGRYKRMFPDLPGYRRLAYALLGEVHIPGKIRHEHVLRRIRALFPDRKSALSVLDAGCGRGEIAFALARAYPNWKILGVDLDGERVRSVDAVKGRLAADNVEFACLDLFESAGWGRRFDLIVCSDVLEHIRNDQDMVNVFHGLLNPGGILLMTFPSVPQLPHLAGVKKREQRLGIGIEDIGHVRQGYSTDGAARILSSAGFADHDVRWTFGRCGTLAFDIFFIIGDNRPNPALFLLAFPLLAFLAVLDVRGDHPAGSALLVTGRKPSGREGDSAVCRP